MKFILGFGALFLALGFIPWMWHLVRKEFSVIKNPEGKWILRILGVWFVVCIAIGLASAITWFLS